MAASRGILPLVLTGTTGLAVLGFGLSGLSGLEPRLERAAQTVQQGRALPDQADPATPQVPDGPPAVVRRTAPTTAVPSPTITLPDPAAPVVRGVDCPGHHDRTRRADEA